MPTDPLEHIRLLLRHVEAITEVDPQEATLNAQIAQVHAAVAVAAELGTLRKLMESQTQTSDPSSR